MNETANQTQNKEKTPDAAVRQDPAVAMGGQMYKNPNMGSNAVIHLFPKMMARMGITMNTRMNATDSRIAEIIVESSTMSVTEATKLRNDFDGKPGCDELIRLADEIVRYEENHIQAMKKFL